MINLTDRKISPNNRRFNGQSVPKYLLGAAFMDAYDICFGPNSKVYGSVPQTFHNIFIGKLGEQFVSEYFRSRGVKCYRPDYYVNNPSGDTGDLIIVYNNKQYRCSVKTCPYYGKLLVESVKQYDSHGVYIHNGNNIVFDRHYLVRVNQNLTDKINYNVSKNDLFEQIEKLNWKAEITGFITHEDFLEVIKSNHIIHKGELNFNNDSYYVQSGDLRIIK